MACRHNKLSVEAVLLLIEANPDAATTKSADGELPLHKACRGGHILLIKLLFDKRMASASERNFSGMLPVFYLCQSSGKREQDIVHGPEFLETVWTLLRANPDGVTVPVTTTNSSSATTNDLIDTNRRTSTGKRSNAPKLEVRRKENKYIYEICHIGHANRELLDESSGKILFVII